MYLVPERVQGCYIYYEQRIMEVYLDQTHQARRSSHDRLSFQMKQEISETKSYQIWRQFYYLAKPTIGPQIIQNL